MTGLGNFFPHWDKMTDRRRWEFLVKRRNTFLHSRGWKKAIIVLICRHGSPEWLMIYFKRHRWQKYQACVPEPRLVWTTCHPPACHVVAMAPWLVWRPHPQWMWVTGASPAPLVTLAHCHRGGTWHTLSSVSPLRVIPSRCLEVPGSFRQKLQQPLLNHRGGHPRPSGSQPLLGLSSFAFHMVPQNHRAFPSAWPGPAAAGAVSLLHTSQNLFPSTCFPPSLLIQLFSVSSH